MLNYHREVIGLMDSVVDITERKRAEEQLRLQLAVLQSTANGIVVTGRDGIIQWVNPALTTLTGYSPQELIGQNPRLFNSGKQDRAFYQQMWKTILGGQPWHGELINKRKDGSIYPEELTITPVMDGGGGNHAFHRNQRRSRYECSPGALARGILGRDGCSIRGGPESLLENRGRSHSA